MNVQLPFKKTDNTAYTAKELIDALAKESAGHYLLGNHSFWHGGVHFTDKANIELKNLPIRCIADGKVIAYRINKAYESSKLTIKGTDGQEKTFEYKYSTSFCLVKHEYASPVAPTQTKPSTKPTTKEGWVGHTIQLGQGRNVRNPDAESGKNNCTFEHLLPASSQLKITRVNGQYAAAKLVSLPMRAGRKVTTIANALKGESATPTEKKIGDEVYFLAFDKDGSVTSSGKLFSDAPPQDWGKSQTITAQSTLIGYDTLISPEKIRATIRAGIQLDVISISSPTARKEGEEKKVYAQVRTRETLVGREITEKYPNGIETLVIDKPLWVAITDELGNVETFEEGDGKGGKKDSPAVKDDTRNRLTFYSLYMHLLPYDEYKESSLSNKKFVETIINGVDERNAAKDGNAVVKGSVPKGQVYEVVAESEADGFKFYQGYRADKGGNRTSTEAVWFKTGANNAKGVFINYVKAYAPTTQGMLPPAYWYHQAKVTAKVTARTEALTFSTENKLGQLSEALEAGDTFKYSTPEDISERTFTDQNGKSVTAQVIKCTFESSQNKDKKLSRGATFHLIRNAATLKKLEEQVEPKEFDKVVSVFLDFAIKGGAPMGYLGSYETLVDRDGGVNAKKQVHLEVFSNDTRRMDDFLNNKANIKTGKGYLRLKRGAVLHIAKTPDEITPLQPSSNTPSVSTPGYVPTPSSTTPSSVQVKVKNLQVVALSEAPISKDKQGQEWYAVTIYEDKPCKVGWISKKDSNIDIVTQHDWKKLGFTVIEEKGGKGEGALQDSFVDANKVDAQADENLPNAGATSFFQELYKEIDTDGKEGVTPDEIQKALKDPELSERINKIIAYHPTEWKDDSKSEKWKRLGTEFLKGEENKPLLQHEQKRIDDLIFWGKVRELSNTPKVYHFNPIVFIKTINSAIVTYHIYADTSIEKHIPSAVSEEYKNIYRYIYHAKNGTQHHICDVPWHTIKRKKDGTRYSANYLTEFSKNVGDETGKITESNLSEKIDEGTITKRVTYKNGDVHITITPNSGVDIQQRVSRTNGDIYEYSSGYKWRKYAVDTANPKNVEVVHVPKGLKIEHEGEHVMEFAFHDTARFYANPNLFAGFIGVIGQIGFKAESTGFAFEQGSCFPSSEHANGESFDFRYFILHAPAELSTTERKKRDNTIAEAAKDFYFEKRIVGPNYKTWLVNVTLYDGKHNDHFHFGLFNNKKVSEIKG